jgi:hypothetical protein
MVVATSGENDVLWTALDPVRRGPGVIVSFCLDRDQPLRRWLRRLRRLPEGRRILRFAGAKKGQA